MKGFLMKRKESESVRGSQNFSALPTLRSSKKEPEQAEKLIKIASLKEIRPKNSQLTQRQNVTSARRQIQVS